MEHVISNTNNTNEKNYILEYSNLKKNLNIENDIKKISIRRGNSFFTTKKSSISKGEDISLVQR